MIKTLFISLFLCLHFAAAGQLQMLLKGAQFPGDIPDLELRLESDLGITLNGSNVSTWADQSGNGNDAAQATAADQPAYGTNQLNGYDLLTFDGSTEHLSGPANMPASNSDRTIFILSKFSPASGLFVPFSYGGSGNGESFQFVISDTETSLAVGGGRWGVNNGDNAFKILTSIWDSATSLTDTELLIDGKRTTEVLTAGSDQTLNTTDNVFYVGTNFNASAVFLDGDIAAILVYSRALSDQERNRVEKYLSIKYGISIN